MKPEVYALVDINGYASQMRDAAANTLSENGSQENLDNYISIGQIRNLIKQHCLGFDSESRPLLDENTNDKIYEDIVVWIHNVGLAKLAAQDLVECAWDIDTNEMVFWAKDTVTTKEKKSNVKRRNRNKNMGNKE
jgi:hypothetical protein